MYSLARSTMRLNSSGVVFERGAPPPPSVARAAHDLRRRFVERPVERIDHRRQAFDRARERRLRGHAGLRPHRRDDGDRILDRVEGDHQGRPDEDRIGNADRVGTRRRQESSISRTMS